MKMKAAVMYEQGKPRPYVQTTPLVVQEVELDPPGEGEVLVEVAAAGLCHSDLSSIEGIRARPLPIIIGHEGAGIVRECGPGVRGLKPGDHVVSVFVTSCGECGYCARGKVNLCPSSFAARSTGTLTSGAKRLRVDGKPLNHGSGLSLYAQYTVVMRNALVKIDDDIPLDQAAIFGCAVMTGAGAVFNTAQLRPGAEVAVIGLGGVGMNALFAAVAAGAERIIAIDTNQAKLAMAREWGATDTFQAGPDSVKEIMEATGGIGIETVIETAGAVKALELGYAITARGGSVISAGLPATESRFTIAPAAMVTDEKSIRGSYMGSCVPARDLPMLLKLYKRGKLPVQRLISGHIGFDQINEGFDKLADGGVLRQMLLPNG